MRRCVLGEALLDWENIRAAALDHFPTYSAFIDKWEKEIVAQADRSPEGQDGETRLDRNDESAVAKPCAQTERP
jgi:hypothetical protein